MAISELLPFTGVQFLIGPHPKPFSSLIEAAKRQPCPSRIQSMCVILRDSKASNAVSVFVPCVGQVGLNRGLDDSGSSESCLKSRLLDDALGLALLWGRAFFIAALPKRGEALKLAKPIAHLFAAVELGRFQGRPIHAKFAGGGSSNTLRQRCQR